MITKNLGITCLILTTLSGYALAADNVGLQGNNQQAVSDKGLDMNQSKDDKISVMAADKKFYVALNAMFTGDAKPMEAAWSHADDVMYMGPDNTVLKGWKAVSAVWQEQAARKLGGKVVPEDGQVTVGQDMAIVYNTETGENVDKDGNPLKVSIRATNVYRKENGQWIMIGHHTDLLPYLSAKKAASQ